MANYSPDQAGFLSGNEEAQARRASIMQAALDGGMSISGHFPSHKETLAAVAEFAASPYPHDLGGAAVGMASQTEVIQPTEQRFADVA